MICPKCNIDHGGPESSYMGTPLVGCPNMELNKMELYRSEIKQADFFESAKSYLEEPIPFSFDPNDLSELEILKGFSFTRGWKACLRYLKIKGGDTTEEANHERKVQMASVDNGK